MENIISKKIEISTKENAKPKTKKKPLVIIASVFFWICLTLFLLLAIFWIDDKENIGGVYGRICLHLMRIFFVIIPIILTLGFILASHSFARFREHLRYAIECDRGLLDFYNFEEFFTVVSSIIIVLSIVSLILLLLDIRKNKGKVNGKEYVFSALFLVFIVILSSIIIDRLYHLYDPYYFQYDLI